MGMSRLVGRAGGFVSRGFRLWILVPRDDGLISFAAGENLVQKWQVLSEVLSCSEKLVSRLGRLGSVSEAKAFCLEALKLTTKLQIPHQ